MRFFSQKKRSYRAAFRVERNRAGAEQLRVEEPDVYRQILAGADGSAAEEGARADPDAYVALILAELKDRGVIGPSAGPIMDDEEEAHPEWNEAEVTEVIAAIEPGLAEMATNSEGVLMVYPDWAMRTWVKMELARVFDVGADVYAEVAAGPNPDLLSTWFEHEGRHSEVEAVYDRVFAIHGLTALVGEVLRRVLLGGADAEYYAKHMHE